MSFGPRISLQLLFGSSGDNCGFKETIFQLTQLHLGPFQAPILTGFTLPLLSLVLLQDPSNCFSFLSPHNLYLHQKQTNKQTNKYNQLWN